MKCLSTAAAAFIMILALLYSASESVAAKGKAENSGTSAPRLPFYPERSSTTDLEVSGSVAGLEAGMKGFVRYGDLVKLPQVRLTVDKDENFSELASKQSVHISGIPLAAITQALGAQSVTDMIEAICTDKYQGYYSADYISEHQPILALAINGQTIGEWARASSQANLGPYFITHDKFMPAFKILAHADEAQVPTNVVELRFTTTATTYGMIEPDVTFGSATPEQQGFIIARQNCLRCHNQGDVGGTKAGLPWGMLGNIARNQPTFFMKYVRDSKSINPDAKMPANLEYDAQTLAALVAYFRTFANNQNTKP